MGVEEDLVVVILVVVEKLVFVEDIGLVDEEEDEGEFLVQVLVVKKFVWFVVFLFQFLFEFKVLSFKELYSLFVWEQLVLLEVWKLQYQWVVLQVK